MSTVAYAYIDPYGDAAVTEASFGQPVDRLYVDQRLEGGDRPALQTLLQACATQPPTTLLVRELGELGATLTAVFDTVQTLEAHGVRVATLDDSYGTASEATAGEGRDRLLALADRVQAQHRRQQLQAGHARNRVSLLPPPGRAPYGYRRGRYRYALDRATAPAVKAFFEHFILYGSIRGAARFLEKNYGKRIAASTAQRWLLHPVYRGDLLYKDGRVIRDTHTPIIAREEAAQVDRLLRRNRKLPPKTVSAGRSLAGLVQCAECQSQLKVSRVTRPRQAREYLYLRPIACGRAKPCKAIAYDAVLDQTVATICAELPPAVANLKAPPVSALKASLRQHIAHHEETLAQLPALQQQSILDEASANLRAYTLRSELAALHQQLSQLPPENLPQIAQTLASPAFWQDLSEAERRVYLREFVQTVQIVRQGAAWAVQIQFVF